jgi:FKBP-type peptidyl-prolyl cis-trans isomerase
MKSFKFTTLPAIALLGLATCPYSASAQTVYRCGNSYSQTPCAGAIEVPVEDARTEAQRTAAREGLARDKALGKEMETTRRKDEAQMLAQEKMAQAAQAKLAAQHKAEAKQTEDKKQAHAKKPQAKKTEREVFTATVGGGKPAHKSK